MGSPSRKENEDKEAEDGETKGTERGRVFVTLCSNFGESDVFGDRCVSRVCTD